MEPMDAWSKFFQTGNVLDYLRYSAIRDSQDYLIDDSKKVKGENVSFPENGMKA